MAYNICHPDPISLGSGTFIIHNNLHGVLGALNDDIGPYRQLILFIPFFQPKHIVVLPNRPTRKGIAGSTIYKLKKNRVIVTHREEGLSFGGEGQGSHPLVWIVEYNRDLISARFGGGNVFRLR